MSANFCLPDGPDDAKIVVLTDRPAYADLNDGRFLTDHAGRLLWDSLREGGGILRSQVRVEAICEQDIQNRQLYMLSREERANYETQCLDRLSRLRPNLIIALGDWPLELLTGHKSSDKYHLSVLDALRPEAPKVLSLLHPERCFREYVSQFYLRLGAARARREAETRTLTRVERVLHTRGRFSDLNSFEIFIESFLKRSREANWLSVDIETAYGQITCLGVGTHPGEALCIPTKPENWSSPEQWWRIWKAIASCLGGSARKVLQNGIYDLTYLATYGVSVENFYHDTMVAQRILYPELPVGLDNIARIYTDEPYWKDEGKDHTNVKDWESYYRYNAKDVCVTLAAAWAQRVDLERRGLRDFFQHTMQYASGPVLEASWRGLPLDVSKREELAQEASRRVTSLEMALNSISQEKLGRPTNPRSPAQVKLLLQASGFKRLPFKDGKETSDKGALMKLRLKSPDSKLLESLIDISEVQKELSSYLRFDYDQARNTIPFTLYAAGTETMRSSCGKDPWNRGLNAQTLPAHLRSMVLSPEGSSFVEVDLAQADARVVAWDSAEPKLMEFFNTGRDIHRYVAALPELFNCPEDAVTHEQRQLGKKVGHAANYGTSPPTLVEAALKEMNFVLSVNRAEQMLSGYYRTFAGIPRWHRRIQDTLSRTRALECPTGFKRAFMGRLEESMHREAYAFLPQHLVAYTINKLILRAYGLFPFNLQIHDSALFCVEDSQIPALLELVKDQDSWNPTYSLAGGPLRIPIEIKQGKRWGEMSKIYAG